MCKSLTHEITDFCTKKLEPDLKFISFNKKLIIRPDTEKAGFLLQGGRGTLPQNDFPPKRRLPPKIFEKTTERTIETIVYCFEKQWSIVFAPLKFFLAESQIGGTLLYQNSLRNPKNFRTCEPFKFSNARFFYPY